MLNGAVYAETSPTSTGDHDSDTIPDLKIRFKKQNLQGILNPGTNVEIIITGELYDATHFEGTDYVTIK